MHACERVDSADVVLSVSLMRVYVHAFEKAQLCEFRDKIMLSERKRDVRFNRMCVLFPCISNSFVSTYSLTTHLFANCLAHVVA